MVEKYVVILGAGRGSRMESRDPNHSKVAYPILGKPLINYVIDACKAIKPKCNQCPLRKYCKLKIMNNKV